MQSEIIESNEVQTGGFVMESISRLNGDMNNLSNQLILMKTHFDSEIDLLKKDIERGDEDRKRINDKIDHLRTDINQVNTNVNMISESLSGEFGIIETLKGVKDEVKKASKRSSFHAGVISIVTILFTGVIGIAFFVGTGKTIGL